MWIGVTSRFQRFLSELELTPAQSLDGWTKQGGVRSCLNRHYYATNSDSENSFLVGSWGKGTKVRPPRDIDLMFVLPPAVHARFELRMGNRQSALLQEVKAVLQATYPNTDMGGNGQVVMVDFHSYKVEVVPAFLLESGNYFICDTNSGGRYKMTDAIGEINSLRTSNTNFANNLVPLIKMMKAWQRWCSVPLKSFHLEMLMNDFLAQSRWSQNGLFYYDWLARDFFAYIYGRANSLMYVSASSEFVNLGEEWKSKAESAFNRAEKACDYEHIDYVATAGEEWQKIFGPQIPIS